MSNDEVSKPTCLMSSYNSLQIFQATHGITLSGVTGENYTIQTSFLRKEDLEKNINVNTTNNRNVARKEKIHQVIPEDMKEHYMTNFSSSDTHHYYDQETRERGQSMPVRWPERRIGYNHNTPVHYQNTVGRVPYQSYHSTLVPVVIKKTPLYLPGLNSYYRKMNIQRRTEKPRIEPLFDTNTMQSVKQKLKEIIFGNRGF